MSLASPPVVKPVVKPVDSSSDLFIDPVRLSRSREFCEQLTRRAARNFYYGLKLLPEHKRAAMFALYAYMRLVDDIADDSDHRTRGQRIAELDRWRRRTHAVVGGDLGGELSAEITGESTAEITGEIPGETLGSDEQNDLWPAFAEMVHHRKVPGYIFDDVIAGQQQDLDFTAFNTFEPLREYCYRVAGVVGLASIHVWGFDGSTQTEQLAVDRGIAFQLTNILRDLREDAGKDRVYLPAEEMGRFGVSIDDLKSERGGDAFLKLMRFQIERAESYYDRSADLTDRIAPDSRPTLIAMTEIYRGLLHKIAAEPQRVLHERVSLSLLRKLHIGWRATRSR